MFRVIVLNFWWEIRETGDLEGFFDILRIARALQAIIIYSDGRLGLGLPLTFCITNLFIDSVKNSLLSVDIILGIETDVYIFSR